ncbi:MAG: glycosyltransferase family 4 protein [Syntrophobacteraceae bacterium]
MHRLSRANAKSCKIAVVIAKYGLLGGGERFAAELTERLSQRKDFDIHVFANRWASNSALITFHKVPIVRFPRYLRPLSFAWFAQRMIEKGNFDVVHSHERLFRADILSVHFVPHNGWVRDIRKKRRSLFDRALSELERRMLAAGTASWFLPVSSQVESEFRREYEALPGHWQTVHPGVDLARFTMPDQASCRAEIRARHGIDATDLLLLFVGMNFEVKGLDTIIAAVAQARKMRPEARIRLLVVGRGNERKYKEIARSHGVAEEVVFAGAVPSGIERYYKAADLFVLLSKYDTFGMVVLEAMAAGLPVIISSQVGAKDLVKEACNGFIIPDPGDSCMTAERIIRLTETALRASMGKASMSTASEHDWEVVSEKLIEVFQSNLSRQQDAGLQ